MQGPGDTDTDENTTNDATAGDATYSLRDYIRAQVMRRWNLDLELLGSQRIIVALHVMMKANGTISTAEIVDKHRYATDAVYPPDRDERAQCGDPVLTDILAAR